MRPRGLGTLELLMNRSRKHLSRQARKRGLETSAISAMVDKMLAKLERLRLPPMTKKTTLETLGGLRK